MTSNVQPIRKFSMADEYAVMCKLVALAESVEAIAETPEQKARVQDTVAEMRRKLDSYKQRMGRVGVHE